MQRYRVPDMSCRHCVAAVTNAVKDVDATAKVDIDLPARMLSIETAAEPSKVTQALGAAGYPANAA